MWIFLMGYVMTEKRYKSIRANLECPNGMEYMLIKRNDGFNVCQVCSKYTAKEIVDELNSLADENEQLKKENKKLQCKYDRQLWLYNGLGCEYDWLKEENEQLKQQFNYIQNSISEHIKHQKTELGQKALQEIIEDYNEWLLRHKEVKE